MEKNIFKKLVYAGIGLAIVGKRKTEEFLKDLAEKTDINEKELDVYLDDLARETEKAREQVEEKINAKVKERLDKMDIPSREEVNILEERIAALESKLSAKSPG